MSDVVDIIRRKRRESDKILKEGDWDLRRLAYSYRKEAKDLADALRHDLSIFNCMRFTNFESAWKAFVREYLPSHPEFDPSINEHAIAMKCEFNSWLYRPSKGWNKR